MGRMSLTDPIWELKQPFQTRQEVEKKLKIILDLIEEGNWIRADYEEDILHTKLKRMIKKVMKKNPM